VCAFFVFVLFCWFFFAVVFCLFRFFLLLNINFNFYKISYVKILLATTTKFLTLTLQVEVDVKDALIRRRPLQHSGARIQPLPPAAPCPRKGGHLKSRVPQVKPLTSANKRGYNWRTFSRGIGLQDS
jgi:hypothetical protein